MKAKIIPKTKMVRDMAKQLGLVWTLRDSIFHEKLVELGLVKQSEKILESLVPVHNNKTELFAMWVTLGGDLEIEEIVL